MNSRTNWKAKDIVLIGMMTATVEAAKTALAFLPNIELVSFLFIIYTIVFGKKALPAVFAFVGVECLVWGMNLWVINYLYVWPLLVVITLIMRKSGCRQSNERGLRPGIWRAVRDPLPVYRRAGDDGVLVGGGDPV